jgi:hypothetical protein
METAEIFVELMKEAGYNAYNIKSLVEPNCNNHIKDIVLIEKTACRYSINAIFEGSTVIFRPPGEDRKCESFDLCDPDSFGKIKSHVRTCMKFSGRHCSARCPKLK